MKRVVIESPYAGDVKRNVEYLHACMRDCLAQGEAPFAGHGFYTLVLNDEHPYDRLKGMHASMSWMKVADAVIVYLDRGVSHGMTEGIDAAIAAGVPIVWRRLGGEWAR